MESQEDRPLGARGFLPNGPASDHELTKASLEQRNITFKYEDTQTLVFDSVLEDLMPGISSNTDNVGGDVGGDGGGDGGVENGDVAKSPECSHALACLTSAIKEAYTDEVAFDTALFDALEEGLEPFVTMETVKTEVRTEDDSEKTKTRKFIALENLRWNIRLHGQQLECAIAFATQVTRTGDLKIPKEFGCATSSRHDHSCVIIARKKINETAYSDWEILDCLATVELTRQTKSVVLTTRKKKRKRETGDKNDFFTTEQIKSPISGNGFGALWQTIAYTISDVWTCIARRGAGTERSDGSVKNYSPPTDIPFAFLGCKIEGERGKEEASRYAYGNVVIPEVCGDSFAFNILSNGSFHEQKVDQTVEAAAAAYMKVLLFGVSMGRSIMQRTSSLGENFHPMTGRKLYLCDSDITSRFDLIWSPISSPKFGRDASQGEIWSGQLEGYDSSIFQTTEESLNFCGLNFTDSDDLLLKCSSKMIYNPLVDPNKSWKALKLLTGDDIKKIVNTVLIYAELRNEKEITMLMRDLRKTHKDLRPCKHKSTLSNLWNIFCDLVRSSLLVLAGIDVVHPDIRPGYDITSNIMLRLPTDDRQEQDDGEMVLIDLNGLIRFRDWPAVDHPAYLSTADLNSYSYVWWQCFAIAVTWKQGINQKEGPCGLLQEKFYLRNNPADFNANHVKTLLTTVSGSDWFSKKELTDKRITEILADVLFPLDKTEGQIVS